MFKRLQQIIFMTLVIIMPVHLFAMENDMKWSIPDEPFMDEMTIDIYASMGDVIIPDLVELYNSSGVYKKYNILEILKRINGKESKNAMIDMLESLCTKPLSGEKWHHIPKEEYLKYHILFKLEVTGETGLAVVKERLQSAEGEFRKCLIIGSGFLGDSTYYENIVEILETDADPYSRELGAYALGKIGDKRAIPKLEKALKDDFYYDASGASPGVDDLTPPGVPGAITYPVREAAIHALSDMGVKVNRRWHDMWIGDKIPPGIANKPYTPPPGLTNKPAPPGQEKKQ